MIIYYSAMQGETDARLLQAVETVVSAGEIKICRSVDALSGMLRQPGSRVAIAILLAANKRELLEILFLRDLLAEMKIILILPDSQPEILAKGHLLRPRFLCDQTGNFQEVAAVFNRMIHHPDIHQAAPRTVRKRNV